MKQLEYGDKVVFRNPGVDEIQYSVKLNHLGNRSGRNDKIFNELCISKHEFCTFHYGYRTIKGDRPTSDVEDYPALTRCVEALFKEAIKQGWECSVNGEKYGDAEEEKGKDSSRVKSLKFGDWVESLKLNHYLTEGRKYQVMGVDEDGDPYVHDDHGHSYPLYNTTTIGYFEPCDAPEECKSSDQKYYVHCDTQEKYDLLMKLYERKGWKWSGGDKPTGDPYEEDYPCIDCMDSFKKRSAGGRIDDIATEKPRSEIEEELGEHGLIDRKMYGDGMTKHVALNGKTTRAHVMSTPIARKFFYDRYCGLPCPDLITDDRYRGLSYPDLITDDIIDTSPPVIEIETLLPKGF